MNMVILNSGGFKHKFHPGTWVGQAAGTPFTTLCLDPEEHLQRVGSQ